MDKRLDFLQERPELTGQYAEDGRVLMRYLDRLVPYPPTPEENAELIRARESDPLLEAARRQIKESQDYHDQKLRESAKREEQERATSRPKEDCEAFDHFDGEEFELYLADLFGDMGYNVTQVSPTSSPDFGVDLVLQDEHDRPTIRIAVQAKRYAGMVGIQAVQEVFAGKRHHHCKKAVVVTNSMFTVAAVELARSTGVVLIDRDSLMDMRSSRPYRLFG
jgi:HJR/Mrr/RecB family endonuclease